MSPARARTRTARSGDERTNHKATAPRLEILSNQNSIEKSIKFVVAFFNTDLYSYGDKTGIFLHVPW